MLALLYFRGELDPSGIICGELPIPLYHLTSAIYTFRKLLLSVPVRHTSITGSWVGTGRTFAGISTGVLRTQEPQEFDSSQNSVLPRQSETSPSVRDSQVPQAGCYFRTHPEEHLEEEVSDPPPQFPPLQVEGRQFPNFEQLDLPPALVTLEGAEKPVFSVIPGRI